MFKTIGIVTKPNDPNSERVASELIPFLKNLGTHALFYQQDIQEKAEIIIVLGGDGTLVGAARNFVDYDIPLLGVNLGHLGFLTDFDVDTMLASIEAIFSGDYNLEERSMLESNFFGTKFIALNDVALHRANAPRMIKADIFINDKFVNNGFADGLIINTPTGSTAYALSSGGPIISADVEAFSLVYISPHAMSYRPFIFSINDEVKITLKEPKQGANIVFDGQITMPINAGQNILIKKYHKKLKLIHTNNYDFFSILRNKLNWNQ